MGADLVIVSLLLKPVDNFFLCKHKINSSEDSYTNLEQQNCIESSTSLDELLKSFYSSVVSYLLH